MGRLASLTRRLTKLESDLKLRWLTLVQEAQAQGRVSAPEARRLEQEILAGRLQWEGEDEG